MLSRQIRNEMKKLIYLFLGLFMLSCSDSFLERNPSDSTTDELLLKSKEGCELALQGIYGNALQTHVQVYTSLVNEARADNIAFRFDGTNMWRGIHNYTQGTADNTVGYMIWAGSYMVIDAANFILTHDLEGLTVEEERNDYIAQAKVMRAMAYLDLLNGYSKPVHMNLGDNLGVPIVLKNDYGFYPSRANVIDVYKLIYEDLTDAALKISKNHNPDRANLALVNGLFTRMYMNLAGPIGSSLTYTNFPETESLTSSQAIDKAISHASQVLAIVSPESSFKNLSNGISRKLSESILVAYALSDEYDTGKTHSAYWDSKNDAGSITKVYAEVVDMFSANDKRLKWFYDYHRWIDNFNIYSAEGMNYLEAAKHGVDKGQLTDLVGSEIFGKFAPKDFSATNLDAFLSTADPVNVSEYSNGLGDFNVMRASEIALLRAEAYARQGDNDKARKDFKSVHDRYFDTPVDDETTPMLDQILLEKRIEMLGEGNRMRDLLRLGNSFTRPASSLSSAKIIDIEDNHIQLPISTTEIRVNSNIKQNPGYGK